MINKFKLYKVNESVGGLAHTTKTAAVFPLMPLTVMLVCHTLIQFSYSNSFFN